MQMGLLPYIYRSDSSTSLTTNKHAYHGALARASSVGLSRFIAVPDGIVQDIIGSD